MGKVLKLGAKRLAAGAQCVRLQSDRRQARENSPLTPELKEFIDRAIVPVLVKQYLAVTEGEDNLADDAPDAAHFVSSTAARELRAVKP